MPYATPLEAKIAKKVTKAIVDHRLIEDGDRVMVGLSGGKDSWALIQILDVLRQRAPIAFSLVAVTVDSGYDGYRHDLISKTCEERGWEYRIVHTEIGATIDELLDAEATPCSLCARFRRGVLYRLASEVGATKIALGHHLDDFIETLLLNLFFAGTLKAMPARLVSDDGRHVVIRPLVGVTESEARNYAKASELPIIGCCCPACGDLGLQRQRVKRLIAELEVEHPDIKSSMIRAIGNVASRHLLDRRLHPLPESSDLVAQSGAVPLQIREVGSPSPGSADRRSSAEAVSLQAAAGGLRRLPSQLESRPIISPRRLIHPRGSLMKHSVRHSSVVSLLTAVASVASAQQRPLVTEDPETIGAGNILIEGGFDSERDAVYPASGLTGNLLRVPTLGVSFGFSSILELQVDGGLYNHLNITSIRAGAAFRQARVDRR